MISPAFLKPLPFHSSTIALSAPFLPSLSCRRPGLHLSPRSRIVNLPAFQASVSQPEEYPTSPTATQPPPFLSLLKGVKKIKVNPKSGKKAPLLQSGIKITSATLLLPSGPVADLGISTNRTSTAAVFAPGDLANLDLSSTPFIIFAHGFTQLPENYFSLLSFLALQGYVIIAPHIWVASLLFKPVETKTSKFDRFALAALPAKLQTALLTDSARAFQIAADYTSSVHLFGHSMGGGMALVYAGYARSAVQSVCLMAPEIGNLALTDLNQTVSLDAEDGVERMQKLATKLASKVFLMHGDRDSIVPTSDMEKLFTCFKYTPFTGLARIKRGTHVGFQDTLDVDLDWKPLKTLISIVNFFVYGFHDIFALDTKEQLETAKAVFKSWYENVDKEKGAIKKAVESTDIPSTVSCDWTG